MLMYLYLQKVSFYKLDSFWLEKPYFHRSYFVDVINEIINLPLFPVSNILNGLSNNTHGTPISTFRFVSAIKILLF